MEFFRDKISASLYNSYYACPLAFKLIHIDGFWPKEGPALALGSMWDEMFKAFHKKEDPYEAVKAKKDKHGRNILWSTPPTELQMKHMGMCRKWMEEYSKKPDKLTQPKFDIGFGIPLIRANGDTLKCKVSGYMDGLDILSESKVHGIEVKTTTEPWTQERADTEIQATIYIYYMFVTYGKLFPIEYIVFNKKDYSINRFITTRTLYDFDQLFMKLEQFIKDVEAEKFRKNPNHPFWCSCRTLT